MWSQWRRSYHQCLSGRTRGSPLACHIRRRLLAAPAHARFHGLHMRFRAPLGQHGFITMDLVQCATRSVTVVGGGANPPRSPGPRARRLQLVLDERVVVKVCIHQPSWHARLYLTHTMCTCLLPCASVSRLCRQPPPQTTTVAVATAAAAAV